MSDPVTAVVPAPSSLRAGRVEFARTLAVGALAGALGGLVVGGVLGRLAMRVLAVTSPESAQGGITDDRAVVGVITLAGTLNLATFCAVAGVAGGLLYLWVRRVLPDSSRGRVLRYGGFTGALGGALLVHDHPSFDYTVLRPAWLAVALFVGLPLLFGLLVAAMIEGADREGGPGRRVPAPALIGVGVLVTLPTLCVTLVFIGITFAVVSDPELQRVWRSRGVTVVGRALFAGLVLWGVYGIVADVVSIVTHQPSSAPFNP